jgi:hypothetical protein
MGMTDAVTILESHILEAIFADGKNGKYVDELSWIELENDEKVNLESSAKFDIDFIGMSGSCQLLLHSPPVLQLLGHASCKFYSATSLQIARCSLFKRMLAFGKCGDFLFGEPIGMKESSEQDEDLNESEEPDYSTQCHKTQVKTDSY